MQALASRSPRLSSASSSTSSSVTPGSLFFGLVYFECSNVSEGSSKESKTIAKKLEPMAEKDFNIF